MDKESVGWSRMEGCGQQLCIYMEVNHESCPQGSIFKPVLFSIYISDIENGIKSTLSKFVDYNKVSDTADKTEVGVPSKAKWISI